MAKHARWVWPLPYLALAAIGSTLLIPDLGDRRITGAVLALMDLIGLEFSRRAAHHPRLPATARRPWRYVTVCFALLCVSNLAFTMAGPNRHGLNPALVVALAARLVIFPVLMLGMLAFAIKPLDRRGRWKLAMDVTTAVGGGSILLWYLLIGPALSGRAAIPPVSQFTTVALPMGDLVLVLGVSAVLLRGGLATARRPLGLLLAGTLSYLFADVMLTYSSVYRPEGGLGRWFIPLLALATVLMASAAISQCRLASQAVTVTPQRQPRALNVVPYVALSVGYGVFVVAAVRDDPYPWLGLIAGGLVMTFGVTVRQIIAMQENFALVVTDNLTGLANRVRLRGALTRAAERVRTTEVPMAVLVIDLDDFKKVNDTYGHDVGDRLLVTFADVLRRNVRATDTPARLGGDEFAVVLESVKSAEDAITVAERILADVAARTMQIDDDKLAIRLSIGVAIGTLSPAGVDPHELIHRADLAMYVAKRKRTHSWQLYSPEAMAIEEENAGLRDDLGRAVSAGQLELLYQPIVALATGELVAVEALVRWRHPVRGLISPVTFIPLAEETGVIHDLGAWVLAESCRQVRIWQDRLPPGRSLHLSVNFSPLQLERDTLAEDVFEVLHRTGFNPGDLVMEVTESAMVNDRSAVPQLAALRERGVRVALDDFGTGYSSLRYLTRLPVDILKLDRCFVAELNGDPERSAVAEAVIRLGQILHLDTVAEGIEEPSQATELTLLGCRNAQGYHFARPLSADAMDALVERADQSWPSLPADPRPTAQVAG